LQVFHSLLKSHALDAKLIVRQAIDILVPALPLRMEDGYEMLAHWTKKMITDEGHSNVQLIHVLTIVVRHQQIYYPVRHTLVHLIIQSAQKIASQPTASFDHRKLAIDLIEVTIKWELRRRNEEEQKLISNDIKPIIKEENKSTVTPTADRPFSKPLIETLFVFLIRLACQLSTPTYNQLSQQCIKLIKTARKFAWSTVDVKLVTFERLIHQIELSTPQYSSIATAIDILAFLITTYNLSQIKYTMRTLKRFLILCVQIPQNQRLLESIQNLLSKLIIQIPIDPPPPTSATALSTQIPTLPNTTSVTGTLATLTPTMANNITKGCEDIEPFYSVINKTILDNMSGITDSSRNTITTAVSTPSVQNLSISFTYLKTISKQNPKYVDKITPIITKLLQKLIKDHVSAGTEYNPAFTEYIIECLELLKYRIHTLTQDLRKQFMNTFLPGVTEKSHDILLIRSIIKLVDDWLRYRSGTNNDQQQSCPTLKEKLNILCKLMQCMEKRFLDDSNLYNQFLELILYIYQEPVYKDTEICQKMEPAFLIGLKSTNNNIRQKFFNVL
ncbi:unnamed protein product, partial [Didymodactylos carnosus]